MLQITQIYTTTPPVVGALKPLLPTYAPFPFRLEQGRGDQVFDDQGEAYWDFYGGHCVCSTGHCHPQVVEAIAKQAAALIFYSTAGSVAVRDRAAEALLGFAQSRTDLGLGSVFFCNSGAEANENALKVAALMTGRHRYAAFAGGWHGRTTLALSVTDDPKITQGLEPLLAPCDRLPWDDLAALDAFDFSQVAGVILEPIQSMSGVRTASPAFFQKLQAKAQAAGTLLILDEIQTGMGRLGHPFAASRYGIQPDLITCAKGLASGVPMGALLISEPVARCLKAGDLGSTFGGSPLACAALLATLEVIQVEGLLDRALAAETAIRKGLAGSCVTNVRGAGLLLGLEIPGGAAKLKQHLYSKRILVGGSSQPEVLRLMPPLNLGSLAVEALLEAVHSFPMGD
jgi:acetylornithine/N-succinyldiaminopimelate aminotransferase